MTAADYPQWLIDFAADPILVLVASLASIVALAFTIVIYWKLSRINTQILLRARSTPWRDVLQASATRLAPLLAEEGTNGDQIREILVQSRPTLQALEKALQRRSQDRRRVSRSLRLISRYLGDSFPARLVAFRDARAIYEILLEVAQGLKEEIEQASVYRPGV